MTPCGSSGRVGAERAAAVIERDVLVAECLARRVAFRGPRAHEDAVTRLREDFTKLKKDKVSTNLSGLGLAALPRAGMLVRLREVRRPCWSPQWLSSDERVGLLDAWS